MATSMKRPADVKILLAIHPLSSPALSELWSVNWRPTATTSLSLLFALVVAIKIAGAVWETLAWRAI